MNFILPSFFFPPSLQEAHVNSCYKHFYYFVTEFTLVNPKEFEPLVSVVFSLVAEIFKGGGRDGGIEGGGGGGGGKGGKRERGKKEAFYGISSSLCSRNRVRMREEEKRVRMKAGSLGELYNIHVPLHMYSELD